MEIFMTSIRLQCLLVWSSTRLQHKLSDMSQITEFPKCFMPWAVYFTALLWNITSGNFCLSVMVIPGRFSYEVRWACSLGILLSVFECVVQSVESSTNDPFALTGCSIWCVELLRREIQRQHPGSKINAILIDFFLYDTVKDQEAKGDSALIPHHRTRSIWY